MAAIQVTSANSNSIFQAGMSVFRAMRPYHTPVGYGLVLTGITYPRIAKLSETLIAFTTDYSSGSIRTYSFNGSTWAQVGNIKTVSCTYPQIAALSSTRICFFNGLSSLQAYDWDGTDWTAVGSAFTVTTVALSSGLTALSSTAVAHADPVNDKLTTYTFNGSTWSQTGNSLTITGLGTCSAAALSSTRVAIAHNSTNQIRAYDFNGTDWSQTGSAGTPSLTAPSISAVSSSEILVSQYGESNQYAYTFNGSTWSLKQSFTLPVGATAHTAICYLSASKFVFIETSVYSLRTHTYGIGAIPFVLTFTGTMIQIWMGDSPTPTSFGSTYYTIIGTLIACLAGAMDSTGTLHIAWMEDNGTSSDLCYRDFNCNTGQWVTNTIVNSDIGADPYFANLFIGICVDSNDKPHIAYMALPSISGAATYSTWYINKVGAAWSSNVQVQHVKNRNNYGIDISIDFDNIPVISVGTVIAANGTTVFRGNLNNATSFTGYILNSAVQHHLTGICFAPNGDCYVISLDGINSITVAKVWKHAYDADWGTWTSIDFTFPNSAVRNNMPSLVYAKGKLYLIIEDNYDHDIKYATYDGSQWSSLTTLETGTFHSAKGNWGSWVNNDSAGSLVSYGEEENYDSQISANGYTPMYTGASGSSHVGQSFAGTDALLTKFTVWIRKVNAATAGTVIAHLYSHSGTFGSSSVANVLLATSTNSFSSTAIATSTTAYEFTFENVRLHAGVNYVIVLQNTGGGDSSNCIGINIYNPDGQHAGNMCSYYQSWAYNSTFDLQFLIHVSPITYRDNVEIDYIFQDETATPDIWWNTLSLTIPTSWLTKSLKWYNGASWIAKPLKYYSGGSWVTKTVKRNM